MNPTLKIPVVVYAESTPNPSAMKFVANKSLFEGSMPLEFLNADQSRYSPLAAELFKFPFVKSVFILGNYITVFKSDAVEWNDVMLELREFLREYLSSGKIVLSSPVLPVSGSPTLQTETGNGGNGETENINATIYHNIPQTTN